MINNFSRKNKKDKEKKDLPIDNKVPKQQKKPPAMNAHVIDMSSGIIDINDALDVATWNKKLQAKENASGIIANRLNDAGTTRRPTTISSIGLRDKKALKKDLIVDPANRKEVEEATKSGLILTDEAADSSR
jgi:hypothetical protein